MNKLIVGAALAFAACSLPITKEGGEHGDPSSPDASGVAPDGGTGAALDGATPATCNGYEPCGINPVTPPDGYTLSPGVHYDDYSGIHGTCQDWADCGMRNTHYTSNWVDSGGNPVNPYFNRMGSPFPWTNARYEIDVDPGKVNYTKLHMTAAGDMFAFSDGTKEIQTDRTTGATTCFQRGPSPLKTFMLGNLGGTGDFGAVDWNISALPGDMGNTGNASTCHGSGATTWITVTSDEQLAATTLTPGGKPAYCLLREGHDYYVNFTSRGVWHNVDCTQAQCDMGGFQLTNLTTEDGSTAINSVPCN